MSHDTRQMANRAEVIQHIKVARSQLVKAMESLASIEEALGAIHGVRDEAKKAQGTAQRGPEFDARPLPRRIRATLDKLLKAIDAAEFKIKTTPVTRVERATATIKKAKVKKGG